MSKGFLFKGGDLVLNQMVEGAENLQVKAGLVIGTNQGEWSHDVEEGIDFGAVLRKNPDEAEIRATIERALQHSVDETFVLTEFQLEMVGRAANITFTAVNADGVEIGGAYNYGSN